MVRSFSTYDSADVDRLLDFAGCIEAIRQAMIALSADQRPQPLRSILEMSQNRKFGMMPGLMAGGSASGAKLVSVFADPLVEGRSMHQGVVVLFDGDTGEVRCIADGGSVTEIRTACASAVATDALARTDAKTLAIFGTGRQAASHLRAITMIRPIERVTIWGRTLSGAAAFAHRMETMLDMPVEPTDVGASAAKADIICTVTGAYEPILRGEWVAPGTHVNLVGSSYRGPAEIDSALVRASRYIVDSRASALAAAAELAIAKAAGCVTDDHIVGEIGQVLNGHVTGRCSDSEITIYKSLGHVVQDLASLAYLHDRAQRTVV